MNESIRHRADTIQQILRDHPRQGAGLLRDFTQTYASKQIFEDKAIMLNLDLQLASDEQEKADIIDQMVGLTEEIVNSFDPLAVQFLRNREQLLLEQFHQPPLQSKKVFEGKSLFKEYKSTQFRLEADYLQLNIGQVSGLVGENATGKTTLLRILAGELSLDKGNLSYPLFQENPNKLDWLSIKENIAYVPQDLPDWKGSLKETIQFEAASHGIKGSANDHATDYIIQRLGLHAHIDKKWQQLSGGYKLRFALAQALVWNPKFLIIDEPLAYLDVKAQLVVLNDLKQLAKSFKHPICVLLSSQHIHEIEAVADQMMLMRDGKLAEVLPTDQIGKDRTENVFEFNTPLSITDLIKKLEKLPFNDLKDTGAGYLLRTPLDIGAGEVLTQFTHMETVPDYFRDISNSLKTRFYDDSPS